MWSRVATDSRTVVSPSARNPASRMADLTWALGTGGPVIDRLERHVADDGHRQQGIAPPGMDLGAHRAERLDDPGEGPATQANRHRRGRGSRAARPGSRRSAGSSCPSCRSRGPHRLRAGRRCPAMRPDSRLAGRRSGRARPLPPGAAIRPAVVRTSAPSPAPRMSELPAARAASSRARWLIDLSPGSPGWPRRRAAGRTPATSGSAPPARFGRASMVNACPSRRP